MEVLNKRLLMMRKSSMSTRSTTVGKEMPSVSPSGGGKGQKGRRRGGHVGFPTSQKSEKMNLLDPSDLKVYLV